MALEEEVTIKAQAEVFEMAAIKEEVMMETEVGAFNAVVVVEVDLLM